MMKFSTSTHRDTMLPGHSHVSPETLDTVMYFRVQAPVECSKIDSLLEIIGKVSIEIPAPNASGYGPLER